MNLGNTLVVTGENNVSSDSWSKYKTKTTKVVVQFENFKKAL